MSILDTIMGAVGGSASQVVVQQVSGMIAQKMGLDPAMVQSAVAALMKNHTQPVDTVQAAAEQSGVAPDVMSQIMAHIGGEGALGSLIGHATGGAAPAGGVADVLGGMLGGLMGGTKS
ncbi:MAG: hypothetical protein ACOYLK_02765 [Sphingomonas sp.]